MTKEIPEFPIFVDSPLAAHVTDVFKNIPRSGTRSVRFLQQGRGCVRVEAAAVYPDGGGEQGAEWSACAVHGDVGFGDVRGGEDSASSEERD